MSDGPSVRLGGLGDALQSTPTVPIPSLTEEFPTPPVGLSVLPTVPIPLQIDDLPVPPFPFAEAENWPSIPPHAVNPPQNLPTVPFPLDDAANWPTVPIPDFVF
jgi:hypothetical protein